MATRRCKTVLLALVLTLILGIVTGCSTTGSLVMHESIEGRTVRAAVAALTVISPDSNGNDVAIQLRGQVAAHLLGAGLFKNISDQNDQTADFKISIKLTEITEVSGVSRVMWGALAGANKIAGDVTAIDVKTGQNIRAFSFRGESASHPFSGKSDIKDAINKAAEEIIKGLN